MTRYFKIKFPNGDFEIVKADSMEEVIEKHRLYSVEHKNTRVVELTGEQRAIAISEFEDNDE